MDSRSPLKRQLEVWSRQDLDAAGVTARRRARAVESGRLIAHGNGWYTTPATPSSIAGSLSRGHRATCVTAAEAFGLWVPGTSRVHEARRRGEGASPSGTVSFHAPVLRAWPDDEPVLPLRTALLHAVRCLSAEEAAILLESALEKRLMHPGDVDDLLAEAPERRRRAIGRVSALAGSGSETRVRRFLERRGVRVREQMPIREVGRVDMLVGERLIIECDSVRHHDTGSAYHVDRGRDAAAITQGYMVLRLTWEMVWLDWGRTQERLLTLIHHRVHRSRRR